MRPRLADRRTYTDLADLASAEIRTAQRARPEYARRVTIEDSHKTLQVPQSTLMARRQSFYAPNGSRIPLRVQIPPPASYSMASTPNSARSSRYRTPISPRSSYFDATPQIEELEEPISGQNSPIRRFSEQISPRTITRPSNQRLLTLGPPLPTPQVPRAPSPASIPIPPSPCVPSTPALPAPAAEATVQAPIAPPVAPAPTPAPTPAPKPPEPTPAVAPPPRRASIVASIPNLTGLDLGDGALGGASKIAGIVTWVGGLLLAFRQISIAMGAFFAAMARLFS